MNLKEYFEKEKMDPVVFAVRGGISVSSVYRYMRGERPHRKTAYKIQRMTKGMVSIEDLLPSRDVNS